MPAQIVDVGAPVTRRDLFRRPAPPGDQHTFVARVQRPRVDDLGAHAALAAERRQRPLALEVRAVGRSQRARLPAHPVALAAALDDRLGRLQAEPPRAHAHTSGTRITARCVVAVGSRST